MRPLALLGLAAVAGLTLPGRLAEPLDCDPLLFDLFVRDAGRGRVLYRDMLENKPPGMFACHTAVRAAFGWSPVALHMVDLLVVGAALGLLARCVPAFALLAVYYLTTSAWCHVQADVWCLLPLAAALRLRAVRSQPEARARTASFLARASGYEPKTILEGLLWAVAVWLKPHLLLVAAAAWLGWVGWARRTGRGGLIRDGAGVLAGGLIGGAVGVGLMVWAGQWQPFVAHLTTWAPEYAGADLYAPFGRWECRLGVVVRTAPWSLVALLGLPVAAWQALRAADPWRAVAGAAAVGWAVQGWGLQHLFDYVHVGGTVLVLTLLADLARGRPALVAGLAAVAALGVVGRPGFERYDRPALQEVADFLTAEGCRDGEVGVLTDAALPVYTLAGLTPPTRFYIAQNNLLAYRSRRAAVLAELAGSGQRLAVVELAGLTPSRTPAPADAPLPAGWHGPRRWADRVAFRAGRVLVVRVPAAEVPAFLADVSSYGEVP